MANYSLGRLTLPDIENGHTFIGDNFCQLVAHTSLFEGKTGLSFIDCNCINCDMPLDSVFSHCNRAQVSFCTNLRPELIDKGLSPCSENCSHVVDTDTVYIDSVLVDTIYHYEDTLL